MSEHLINTTRGPLPASMLDARGYTQERETDTAHVLEYWLDGECVHRSAHVIIKQGPSLAELATGTFGG